LGEDKLLMVAGGRELLFEGKEALMFEAGANAMVIGNYLTTEGISVDKDRQMLDKLGYEVATSCGTR
jgi:biotin synthase